MAATQSRSTIWRTEEGAWPSSLALLHVALAHALGIALLAQGGWIPFLAGILLLAHGLVVAGYLIHECAHLVVFRKRDWNMRLGGLLSWLCGASYASFGRIQRMHLRHHGDRADVVCFDLKAYLRSAPAWLRNTVLALEWAHVPASEGVMHAQVMVRPFLEEGLHYERGRVIATAASRLAFFALLFAIGPWVLIGYGIAYLLFVKALFLADAFAHTYPFIVLEHERSALDSSGRNAEWDARNTWSNLVSDRFPVLNVLNLNFGYHNAHHDRPAEPWYRLPEVHANLYPADSVKVMPYREVWRSFHRNRVRCILAEEETGPGEGPGRADGFLAVHGVSFLTIV